MANSKFDAKSFNPEAFRYMVGRIAEAKVSELRRSRAICSNPDIKAALSGQEGTSYARIAMRGLLDGDVVNYDGQTDITATSTKTYEQGVPVIGRAKAWMERDFAYDVTGGVDFMENIAQQVGAYWEGVDQDTILAILEGVFSMTGEKNQEFIDAHTTDVSAEGDGMITATTLNSATRKACGANKKKFSVVFMHSDVSTNLENMQLLEYLKYTDRDGVTRDLSVAAWNGKTVIVDDAMPVSGGLYTTYVLGEGAIALEDVGAKAPYEMARDPKTNGGQDTLYTRQRKAIAPMGISYEKASQATHSPTDEELRNGANWSLVHSGESDEAERSYISHKAIPIARIISKG